MQVCALLLLNQELSCPFYALPSSGLTVRGSRMQSPGYSTVHLWPQVSGHSPARDNPREEHGHSASEADQQVGGCALPLGWEEKRETVPWSGEGFRLCGNKGRLSDPEGKDRCEVRAVRLTLLVAASFLPAAVKPGHPTQRHLQTASHEPVCFVDCFSRITAWVP